MDKIDFIKKFKTLHFVGVGGVSMSALAEYSLRRGVKVSGSNIADCSYCQKLSDMGANLHLKHKAKNVGKPDAVVFSSAIKEDNPELCYARENKIPLIKRSQFLGRILDGYKHSVAVSGSHGKTTSTAMITEILVSAKKDPTAFVGGDTTSFGNFRLGNSEYAVCEGCEYQKNLLDLNPYIAVVLNLDLDHVDTYKDKDDLIETFKKFVTGLNLINADDPDCQKIANTTSVTFGIHNIACYKAEKLKETNGAYSFDFTSYGIKQGRVYLKIKGKHNVYNALCALSVSDLLRIPFSISKIALENFDGVSRRNQFIGEYDGCEYYADYAHHPSEIEAMLNLYNQLDDDYLTVFQPHTYSRTKYFIKQFTSVLKNTNGLIIYKTYPAREDFDEEGSAQTLYLNLLKEEKLNVAYADNEEQLKYYLNFMKKNKVLVLGAGDVYDIVKKVITS